jgi:hypothetical protein
MSIQVYTSLCEFQVVRITLSWAGLGDGREPMRRSLVVLHKTHLTASLEKVIRYDGHNVGFALSSQPALARVFAITSCKARKSEQLPGVAQMSIRLTIL